MCMKKLLLLLLVPMLNAEVQEGHTWDDYIEDLGDSLTHLICESSGERVVTLGDAEERNDVSYTDYYLFNDDVFFSRMEMFEFDTSAWKYLDFDMNTSAGDTELKITDNFILGTRSATKEGLALIKDSERTYSLFEVSLTINRLTGSYKSSLIKKFELDLGLVIDAIKVTGSCSLVSDKKKF